MKTATLSSDTEMIKISHLIKMLQEAKKEYGDLPVYTGKATLEEHPFFKLTHCSARTARVSPLPKLERIVIE